MSMETKEIKLTEMHQILREELTYRRSRQQQIFTWSSAILIAITAAMFVSNPISLIMSCSGKIMAILLVIGISLVSAIWQMKQRRLLSDLQKVVARIMSELGYFDLSHTLDKQSILPNTWKSWGRNYSTWWSQLTHPTKILVTIFLGLVAAFAILMG